MEDEEKPKVAILDGEGKILCLIDGRFKFLDFSEVTLDNIFIFWSGDLDLLEEYFYNIYGWDKDPDQTLSNINLKECSILNIVVDQEKQLFWFE